MDIDIDRPLYSLLSQGLPFLFSFADDALLLGISHLGIHLNWLQWLSPVMMSCTLLYWTVRLAIVLHRGFKNRFEKRFA